MLNELGGPVGACWLLKPEIENSVPAMSQLYISVENIIFSSGHITSLNQRKFFVDKLYVYDTIKQSIAQENIGQSEYDNWIIIKKKT